MKHTTHGQHNQHNDLRELARARENSRANEGTSNHLQGIERIIAISPEAIRHHAYGKWESAGKPEGDGIAFWLTAEKELAARSEDHWGRGNSQDTDRHAQVPHPHSLKL
jgi:hypothetical protein